MLPRDNDLVLARKQHIKYFQRFLQLIPACLSCYDSTRLTLAFFAISGLDILNALDVLDEEKKKHIIDWIYRLQVVPDSSEPNESWKRCGFQGSSTLITPHNESNCSTIYECGHLAMTYTGLASLVILGDDLSRVNRPAILEGVKALQQEDGSYCATLAGSESDMRFIYCAACICYILNDWSAMDIERTMNFITRSMSYDFGIGQAPELESHGGTTFCAVATLALMDQLNTCFTNKQLDGLRRWGLARQVSGFQGRPNKPVDTCYSFWLGAVLKILGVFEMVDYQQNKNYILSTQDPIVGGLSKWIDTTPDPMHTYMGLCGLSLMQAEGLRAVHPALNITTRAYKHLESLHKDWENN
ncbi:geranylgeranyl transferase type-1 subunit beta [Periplaneta americana]|uniref:geranylgeranyl transferase type-1 subunit beta n=1 Tax=Periplaneta americana TaxID=6978 RepID=UPI0037E80EF6